MRVARISANAKRDIDAIWVFIAEDNFDAADRVQDEIEAEVQKLAEFPGMGHTRQDAPDQSYRFWKIYSYVIVYRYTDTEVAVVCILHGARDIASLLR